MKPVVRNLKNVYYDQLDEEATRMVVEYALMCHVFKECEIRGSIYLVRNIIEEEL
jgi:hypothetical protein